MLLSSIYLGPKSCYVGILLRPRMWEIGTWTLRVNGTSRKVTHTNGLGYPFLCGLKVSFLVMAMLLLMMIIKKSSS